VPLFQIQLASGGFDKWHFDHWQDHLDILAGILANLGTTLPQWPIHPYTPTTPESWNRMHLQMHFDMNRTLGLSGTNVGDVDFSDRDSLSSFFGSNYLEHFNVKRALGLI